MTQGNGVVGSISPGAGYSAVASASLLTPDFGTLAMMEIAPATNPAGAYNATFTVPTGSASTVIAAFKTALTSTFQGSKVLHKVTAN